MVDPPADHPVHLSSDTSDEDAVTQAFVRLRPKLLSFASARGIGTAAEDLVQDTLLAAITKIRATGLQGVSSLESWLYGILRHKVADHHRAGGHQPARLVSLQSLDPEFGSQTPLPTALQVTYDQELGLFVRQVLERLPPRHWLILMLNQRQGLKTEEIAPLVGLSPGRVGAILAEAKKMFRREIRGEENPRR